jgi:hypothetical protein
MSQWGETRRFRRGDTVIAVTAHLTGQTWSPAVDAHLIDHLLLVSIKSGSRETARALFDEIKAEWISKTYGEWREIKSPEIITENR